MTSSANTAVLAIDNLLRRELKVGDPRDPQQIAQALAERYRTDVRAQAIGGEAQGMPFLHAPALRQAELVKLTASDVDLAQARNDVALDLQNLLSDNLTKDIRPELEGWQSVVERSIDQGVAAARYGLDPHQRDTAFAMRRQLGDYARLARMVGVLTPMLNQSFRSLAQSIDEVCAVILVLMGESMANLGFAGGRFLLQAPYSELQARRDAVLNALRQMDGVAAMVGQGNTWPRGLRAYRQLSTVLEAKGQGDLRSLMGESELARTMDELIQLAGGASGNGMRALGATAWAPLARLHRFVQTTIRQVKPASPELATLHEALQLFIDGFVPAGGFRLLRVARPSVLNYGLYGPSRITAAEQRLMNLVNHRGALARQLDCLTECACDRNAVVAQIVLDGVLYGVDRAIDLYCVGDADLGLPELRAAAYSHLIEAVSNWMNNLPVEIQFELDAVCCLLRPMDNPARGWVTTKETYDDYLKGNKAWLGGASTVLRFAQVIHDELCLQRDTDQQWRAVIEQMTNGCVSADEIFRDALDNAVGCLPRVIDDALEMIEAETQHAKDDDGESIVVPSASVPLETILPTQYEESLEDIARKL